MADYEELYRQIIGREKELKDKLSAAQKIFKTLIKNSDQGDLKSWYKNEAALQDLLKMQDSILVEMKALVDGFGIRDYVEQGEFAEQMLDYCDRLEVDIKGDYPVYEIFPFRLKIDSESLDLTLNRKKMQCLRPQFFVQEVKKDRDKLFKAAFDPQRFAKELAVAYDRLVKLEDNAKFDGDVALKKIHELLTPMNRFRRDYNQQSFAFDLTRLYTADLRVIEDGRKFQFGPSRNIRSSIRILDQEGREQYLATIRFFEEV